MSTNVEEGKSNRKSRMCASHYGRLRMIMENRDNARTDRARRFPCYSLFRGLIISSSYIYIHI